MLLTTEILDARLVKPYFPVGIKGVGIAYGRRVGIDEFILLQDLLDGDELKNIIKQYASITIKSGNECFTGYYHEVSAFLRTCSDDSADLEIMAVNLPKPLLQKIAREKRIWDYRLIVTGFDSYIKFRSKESIKSKLLEHLLGIRPPEYQEELSPSSFCRTVEKSFGTASLSFLPSDKTIIGLIQDAYHSLQENLQRRIEKYAHLLVSTLTPYDIYTGVIGDFIYAISGAQPGGCFDPISVLEIHEGCVGFIKIIKTASLLSGELNSKSILAITADTLAHLSGSDWKSRGLSSDAATAVCLGRCDKGYGVLGVCDLNLPSLHRVIIEDKLNGGLLMDGPKIRQSIIDYFPQLINHAIKTFAFNRSKVKIIPHQMNGAILAELHKYLNEHKPVGEGEIHPEQIINVVHLYGNSSSSTIPTALYWCIADGKLQKGDEVIMISIGSGFNMGYVTYRVGDEFPEP